jgi:SAM-dependent methyltransferases
LNDKNIQFYTDNAKSFITQYDHVHFESVHQDWISYIPTQGMVLDVGAGSGRDARYLSEKGLSVVAVEPSDGLLEAAKTNAENHNIHWINDSLPELIYVFALQMKFDLILLSAVWMHIAPSNRERTFRKLSSLLKPNGKMVISLRHGECRDERIMHLVSASELAQYAGRFGLTYQLLTHSKQADQLGRKEISWETILLTLPDDGTGAFPLIRNIVVNDSKSSTYKLALLRALLRIADGHPGAVIEQTDQHIRLPLGLVALYWLKLYKPLVDQYDMQQNSSNTKGLSFIKSAGWSQLTSVSNNDLYIGAYYPQTSMASAVSQTLKDIARTIKDMPAKYTTLPGTSDAVFKVEITRSQQCNQDLTLDFDYLKSLGSFYAPKHIWDSLTRYSVWIEPVLINEWASLMAGYGQNKKKPLSKLDYLNALTWDDPQRTTVRVRNKVNTLLSKESVICCWSGSQLRIVDYAIDHVFPFSRWPNNDLWNLLPAKTAVNSQKSDKLPSRIKLSKSKDLILHWWQQAWEDNKPEFFTQARFALPSLTTNRASFDDVFDAMSLQRDRIKDFQQLEDWG